MSNDAYYDSLLLICNQCTREVFSTEEFDVETQLCADCIHMINLFEEEMLE